MSVPVQASIRSLVSRVAKQEAVVLKAGDELDDAFTGLDVS